MFFHSTLSQEYDAEIQYNGMIVCCGIFTDLNPEGKEEWYLEEDITAYGERDQEMELCASELDERDYKELLSLALKAYREGMADL